jgi:hypothetical protein
MESSCPISLEQGWAVPQRIPPRQAGSTLRRASGAFGPRFIGFVACVLRLSLRVPTMHPGKDNQVDGAPEKS